MLYVLFSGADEVKGINYAPNETFSSLCEKEWLNTEFAKRVIKEVDKCEHIKDNYIESPIFGAIPPKELSTGVKNILLLKNLDTKEYKTDLKFMGNNCLKFLMEIAKEKDIYCICCNSIIDFSTVDDFVCYCLNDNKYINDNLTFVTKMYNYIENTLGTPEEDIERFI